MEPTAEQRAAIDMFGQGDSLAIEAGAGTGKSSTLLMIAESAPDLRMQYTAFNKAIVTDIGKKLPPNATANTAHSMAYKVVGHQFSRRLRGGRMRGHQMAQRLGIGPINVRTESGVKVLQPDHLASLVMKAITIYCQGADNLPNDRHFPYIDGIDMPDDRLRRTYENNDLVRAELTPFLAAAWRDIQDPYGVLPFNHGHYLKMWERSDPHIAADIVMFDEAQDASPVMLSIVEQQEHAQLVFVGDAAQAIYEFTGAVDAITNAPVSKRTMLTQSFRFGQAVADVANLILRNIDTPLTLRGLASIASRVEHIEGVPDAVLTRTNAGAVTEVLVQQRAGRDVHLVGGGGEIAQFAKAANELMTVRRTRYPDLACFTSWGEVQEYVKVDPQGDELRLMVNLVDEFGVDTILRALDGGVSEAKAEIVVSTAHKSKGREWDQVRLGGDFPDQIENEQEWKLLYVAATRAQQVLDLEMCGPLRDLVSPKEKASA